MAFAFKRLSIPDVVLVTTEKFGDPRGYLMEFYKDTNFKEFGIAQSFVQDIYSISQKGVLRGMHYQLEPFSQGKLMGPLSGSIYMVVLDIRKGSPTFGKWVQQTLSSKDSQMLWIPKGFAAGGMVLEDNTLMAYKLTAEYSKLHERGILWNDPDIGAVWPKNEAPIISEKDAKHPKLSAAEINFVYGKV